LDNLLVLDDGPEARGLRSHHRRISDDRHQFPNIAHAEVEVDACLLARRETNAVTPHRLEPWEFDIEPVLAGRQAGSREDRRRCRRRIRGRHVGGAGGARHDSYDHKSSQIQTPHRGAPRSRRGSSKPRRKMQSVR